MQLARFAPLGIPWIAFCLACGDDPRGENMTMGGSTGIGSASSTTMPGDGSTSGDPSTTSEGSLDGGSTTGDTGTGPVCETTFCGGTCCGENEDCVLGECLPACGSGVRCGADLTVCCDAGDVCLQPACVSPGIDCIDSFDCPEGEFCEPTLDKCLPQQDPVVCEVLPDFEDISVALEWSFEEEQMITVPIVADIDGDGLPEVIVSTTYHDDDGDGNENGSGEGFISGIIIVFDGVSGQEQFRIEQNPPASWGSYGRTSIGVADVDGNGLPDIIYAGRPVGNPLNQSIIHAVNGQGQHLWASHAPGGNQTSGDYHLYVRNGAPTFANLDDDPESEIIWGAAILDNDGTVVWDQEHPDQPGSTGFGSWFGSPSGYPGGIAAVADLTGDGQPEIISGRHAWLVNWQQGPFFPEVTLSNFWDAGGADGYPAVGDIDTDGDPEVVLVANGQLRILDGATGELWCGVDPTGAACAGNPAARTQPVAIPSGGIGGPPTIADFDGDGRPEIAAAGAASYTVYDIYRSGEDIVQPPGALPPAPGDAYVRWTRETNDASSNATGSSVFDFQGDGVAEVLYADQCYMRVYNGQTGETVLELELSSSTIHEYPIVADVDADGNSEILVVANDALAPTGSHCGLIAGYTPRRGLFVFGDPGDQWVRTRRVWNQHAYHVTNSDSIGLTPLQEANNWENPDLNNYRQNVQGVGVFNAPDLSVDLAVGLSTCLDAEFELIATVRNEGSLGVAPGVEVSLYEGMDASGEFIGTQTTTVALLPGAFTTLQWLVPTPVGQGKNFYVSIDGADGGTTLVTECNEGNNSGITETVSCNTPG